MENLSNAVCYAVYDVELKGENSAFIIHKICTQDIEKDKETISCVRLDCTVQNEHNQEDFTLTFAKTDFKNWLYTFYAIGEGRETQTEVAFQGEKLILTLDLKTSKAYLNVVNMHEGQEKCAQIVCSKRDLRDFHARISRLVNVM